LKKRKLYFQRVLALMRHTILAKQGRRGSEFTGKIRVDLRAAQRRLPGSLGINGLRFAARKVPWPKQKKPPRQFQLSVNGSGNMTRIPITCVGNHAGERWAGTFFLRGNERGDLAREFLRIFGVKTAGNGRQAKHRMCHPSILKAISAAGEMLLISVRRKKS
jgi:hypothetical protein